MQFDEDDLSVVKEEEIKTRIKLQGIVHAQLAFKLSILVVGAYALFGLFVLVYAFFKNAQPPLWATAVQSSTITAALAVIFKDHMPRTDDGKRR